MILTLLLCDSMIFGFLGLLFMAMSETPGREFKEASALRGLAFWGALLCVINVVAAASLVFRSAP